MKTDPRTIQVSLVNRALARVFEHLGPTPNDGEHKLEAILIEFYRRMASDLLLEHFFYGKDVDQVARKQKEFLLRAMGARVSYEGKPPAQAHDDIPNILEGHFNRRLVILGEVLRAHGVSEQDTEIWISFENAFRDAIVKPEGPREPVR